MLIIHIYIYTLIYILITGITYSYICYITGVVKMHCILENTLPYKPSRFLDMRETDTQSAASRPIYYFSIACLRADVDDVLSADLLKATLWGGNSI